MTQPQPLLLVQGLTKSFALYAQPIDRLKEALFKKHHHTTHKALSDVTFNLHAGESLGIIGRNGAGKSTLLKLLTGVLDADGGRIERQGRLAGLLELGTGFDVMATGRENIAINAGLMGLSQTEISAMTPQVIAFSELGQFIDMPVRSYSSGMAMRLGFSIAFHSRPEAFVVDEALSVGDVRFQQKCFKKIQDFKDEGGGLLFVSHDLNAVRLLCDRVLVLHEGQLAFDGEPSEAVQIYYKLMASQEDELRDASSRKDQTAPEPESKQRTKPSLPGYGHQNVRIKGVQWSCSGLSAHVPAESCTTEEPSHDIQKGPNDAQASLASGEWITLTLKLHSNISYKASLGVLLRDRFGQDIFGVNTAMLDMALDLKPHQTQDVTIRLQLAVAPGRYTATFAVHTDTTHHDDCQHWWDNALTIEVLGFSNRPFSGLCNLPCEIRLNNPAPYDIAN